MDRLEPTDEDLMARVAACADQSAFEMLFARYRRSVVSLCLRFLHHRDRAEATAQETFLRVLQHREKYQPPHRFSSWILSIAANLCRDQLKRRDHIVGGGDQFPGDATRWAADPAATPDQQAATAETNAQVMAAVASLEPIFREIITLRIFQGLSYKEISDITGCNESTARSRMELALRHLRKTLSMPPRGRV